MTTIAVLLLTAYAQAASAQQRVNKPFTTINGRATITPAPERRDPGAPAATAAPAALPAGGGGANSAPPQAHFAARRQNRPFTSGASRAFAGRLQARRIDGGGQAPAPAPEEEKPPYYEKPGALIRSTGQLPLYEKAETGRTHAIDAGEIVLSAREASDVGRAPSLRRGRPDKRPPPNPARDSRGAIIANSGGSSPNSSLVDVDVDAF